MRKLLDMLSAKTRFLAPLLILVSAMAMHAESRTVLSAKVVRIEPWMPIKITCGIALVTRLAEYEVNTVYQGHLDSRRVIVRHLACNGNELDDLKVGDDVLLVLNVMKTPEKHVWHSSSLDGDQGPALIVRFNAVEVAKKIFPTHSIGSKP